MAVIRSTAYKQDYINEKLDFCIKEIQLLHDIGKTKPQSALSCFIGRYKLKLNYCVRTIPNIENLLKILEYVKTKQLIPSITGGIKCSNVERRILSLPPRIKGLGIPVFSKITKFKKM